MSSGSWPNFDAWLQTAWGAGAEFWSAGYRRGLVLGPVTCGQNPPYYLDDFLGMYPKFFGTPTALAGCTVTVGSSAIGVPSTAGLAYGQLVQAAGVLPPGTVITGVGTGSITVNNLSLVTQTGVTLQTYQAPPLPTVVIQAYINLAAASLNAVLWAEQWYLAVGWFVAHYCTLYAETDVAELQTAMQTIIHGETPQGAIPGTAYTLSVAPPAAALQSFTRNGVFLMPGTGYTLAGNQVTLAVETQAGDVLYAAWPVAQEVSTPGIPTGAAIAAQGVANGIMTSKSVGDVSASYQALESLSDWGAWNLTKYGQQLATMARVVGSGPAMVW